MKRRRNEGFFYEESELWHIIASVIAALAFMASHGLTHGDIRPKSLLLNEEGKVKIIPSPIADGAKGINNYMQALMGMDKAKYLSPQLLLQLDKQNHNPQHDVAKSDAFSLGLIVLEAALLQE